MKKFLIIVFFAMVMTNVRAETFNIREHVVHFDSGLYYKIYLNDTFYIDTTTLILKYFSNTENEDILGIESTYGLTRKHEFITGSISYNYTTNQSFISFCTDLASETEIEFFEFNTTVKLLCESMIPNDSQFEDQWYLERMEVPKAWNLTTGSGSIKVAIIDTGFDWEHDDLGPGNDNYESTFLNPDEEEWNTWNDPCTGDKIDDDGNGYIDDWKGRRWGTDLCSPNYNLHNDARPFSISFLEGQGLNGDQLTIWRRHGTFIAGIIGAKTNNDEPNNYDEDISGIAGGWGNKGVSLIYYKVFPNHNGNVSLSEDLMIGIEYAIGFSPDIIQLAWASTEYPPLSELLTSAYDQGIYIVAGSGNNYPSVTYPASHEHVFAVGATGIDDYVRSYSSGGTELDLCAPGEASLGLSLDEPFIEIEGYTSAASAMVSGTVGLMLSINPELTNTEITDILHASAEKVHSDFYNYDENGRCDEIGYGRLNTYNAVCKAWEYIDVDEEITSNTTWSEPKYFMNDVIVRQNAKLTITSEVQFGPDAKLIVEAGANLEIDGGLLTNLKCCGYEGTMWKGIEVWGDKTKHQNQYSPGHWYQGRIVMKNGATIENAEIGVLLGKRNDSPGFAFSGGILQINKNSSLEKPEVYFINNRHSVFFNPYSYKIQQFPPIYQDNVSYVYDSYFELNDDYLGTYLFDSHVYFYNIKGVRILGCTLINDKTAKTGHGINSWGSGFLVDAFCNENVLPPCPEQYLVKTTFKNFTKAINQPSYSIFAITIKNSIFDDNSNGIVLTSVRNPTILFNDFYIGQAGTEEKEQCGEDATGYGIDLSGCSGFAIEENLFTRVQGASEANYIGIRIANTNSVDQVYKNNFQDLSRGNYAEGKNWRVNDIWSGLAYYCNENTRNYEDFYIAEGDPSGIQSEIGSTEMGAGNTFTDGADNNFKNLGNHEITYYYFNGNPDEYPDVVTHVGREPVSIQNPCLSHYGGGGGGGTGRDLVLTPEQKLQAERDFVENFEDYSNVRTLYENLKDGGNTNALKTEVETSWPQDMWELRAELLGKSPHLSMEVLKSAADKTDVLPESVIFEIMAANPDELKKEELIKYLEDKENPLPEYLIEILQQVASGITYKTVLHSQMAYYNQIKSRAAHDIIRSLLNDTLTDYAELRNWLDNIGGVKADEQIIYTYLYENNFADALTLANLLPQLYNYDEEDMTEHNYFMDMLNFEYSLTQQGLSFFELDSTEINNLIFYAENSKGPAGEYAKGILEFAYGYHYCHCLNIDSAGYKHSGEINYDALKNVYGPFIIVNPNPAHEWTAFNFTLNDNESEGIIKITDVAGKFIESLKVKGKQGQKIWDTRQIKQGVYFYNFTVNGYSKSGKIVINK